MHETRVCSQQNTSRSVVQIRVQKANTKMTGNSSIYYSPAVLNEVGRNEVKGYYFRVHELKRAGNNTPDESIHINWHPLYNFALK